jgi:hypothetical protein
MDGSEGEEHAHLGAQIIGPAFRRLMGRLLQLYGTGSESWCSLDLKRSWAAKGEVICSVWNGVLELRQVFLREGRKNATR